jgi:hypothetical protein
MTTDPFDIVHEALKICADELEYEVDSRYGGAQDTCTDTMKRYQNDIRPVTKARDALAALDAALDAADAVAGGQRSPCAIG